ncbi:hypothetical protein ACTXT7_000706 [Hymenolepis weldensis]
MNRLALSVGQHRLMKTDANISKIKLDLPENVSGEVKACPRCHTLLLKLDDGSCNHMSCFICGCEFCWLCLREVRDTHFLSNLGVCASPTGCTFWGRQRWPFRRRIWAMLIAAFGTPFILAIVTALAIPGIVIGFPAYVSYKVGQRILGGKCKRILLKTLAFFGGLLVSPVIAEDLMADTTITNEIKRHAVIVSIKAKPSNWKLQDFYKAPHLLFAKVRRELLNENNGDGLAATNKRKQHCQHSADSLIKPEFVRKVHGMIDESPGKSMCDILPNIFKCLKEQQYGHRVNADAHVETLQIIVVKPPWIDSVANRGRPYVFHQDSAPSHKALKTRDWLDDREFSLSCHAKFLMAS